MTRRRKSRHSVPPFQHGLKRCSSRSYCYNPGDRISQLPDEILLLLLSMLPIKDAAVTSLLSTRWRYLWAFIPRLNFNASFFPIDPRVDVTNALRTQCVRRVNKVIKKHEGHNLEEFRLHLTLTEQEQGFVDKCLQYASSKNVRMLELDFSLRFKIGNIPEMMCTFTVEALNQTGRHGSLPASNNSFHGVKSLISLCLSTVRMSTDVLDGILSHCLFLERLKLEHVAELDCVKVVGPSLRLSHLELSDCYELKRIEIYDAVSLVSFKWWGCSADLFMRNLPCLIDLSFTTPVDSVGQFCFFASYLSQLKRLTIYFEKLLLDDQHRCELTSLGELDIALDAKSVEDLLRLMPLIEASPYLQKIIVRVRDRRSVKEEEEEEEEGTSRKLVKVDRLMGGGRRLEHLKVLEIAGYNGAADQHRFISYIIESAVSLETIIISSEYQSSDAWADCFYHRLEMIHESEDYVRLHAKQWLQGIIPPGIRLVIQ